MHFLTCIRQKYIILHQIQIRQQRKTTALTNHKRRYSWRRVSDGTSQNTYSVANSWRCPIRRRVIFADALEFNIDVR